MGKEDGTKKQRAGLYMTVVKAQMWGNSLGVRIPKEAADKVGIERGTEIELEVTQVGEGCIQLRPKRRQKEYILDDLLKQVTEDNRHGEVELGKEGRELI